MLAVGMYRNQLGVHTFEIPRPEIKQPDEVLIRMKEVGLDGTDYNIVRHNAPDIAEGWDKIVLAHEGVGVVEAVGSAVKSVAPGDIVVLTVRRSCGQCQPCLHNQSDMCMTGLFTERGIHKADGILTQFVVDKEQYVVKVPPEIKHLAVLTEPLSIVEKGVHELRVIQSRVPWYCPHSDHDWLLPQWGGCKVVLVVGAGPLGLLATALIRLANAHTYTADIVSEDHPKAQLVKEMGATYINAQGKEPKEIVEFCCTPTGQLNIIFEASGAAKTAIRLIRFMSRSSIYTMTGIPSGDLELEVDAGLVVRRIVRYNQVIVGSVNSNRRHFEMALKDLGNINQQLDHVMDKMITRRVRLQDYQQAFDLSDKKQVKTVVEVEPWN
jgi:threonine dehydrogenase-like Zn-dependent dehydrogenase